MVIEWVITLISLSRTVSISTSLSIGNAVNANPTTHNLLFAINFKEIDKKKTNNIELQNSENNHDLSLEMATLHQLTMFIKYLTSCLEWNKDIYYNNNQIRRKSWDMIR